MFGPDHDYKVGDDAWIFVGAHQGEMSKGKVLAILDGLPGWSYRHYVIEIPTHIEPLLEIRSSMAMRPTDPRVGEIAALLAQEFGEERARCLTVARNVLEIAAQSS